MTITLHKTLFGAAMLAALGTAPAHAVVVVNPLNFAAFGDALVTGMTTAMLSTAHSADGETTVSGTDAVFINDLEAGLQVASGALGLNAYEGSALFGSFNLPMPSTVSFNWVLSTVNFAPALADQAFVVVNGVVQLLGTSAAQAVNGNFSFNFAAGNHTLSLAVVDVGDFVGKTTLSVSELSVTAVPEPGTYALWLAGLAVVGGVARRQRSAAAR